MKKKDKGDRGLVRRVLTGVVMGIDFVFGRKKPVLQTYECASPRVSPELDGARLVVLTDLHARRFGKHQEKLLAAVQSAEPTVIILPGDMLESEYTEREKKALRPLFEALPKLAPTYAAEGNHETRSGTHWKMIAEMEKCGIPVLREKGIEVPCGEGQFFLGTLTPKGIGSLLNQAGYSEELVNRAKALRAQCESDSLRILLAHRPELWENYLGLGFDLVISGHAHGGLMKLPFGRRLLAPGQGFFPKYTEGSRIVEGTQFVIGRGLGGPRIGIPPEVMVITLKSE